MSSLEISKPDQERLKFAATEYGVAKSKFEGLALEILQTGGVPPAPEENRYFAVVSPDYSEITIEDSKPESEAV
jgi:hypothetical protein